jgi:hypothetical protein
MHDKSNKPENDQPSDLLQLYLCKSEEERSADGMKGITVTRPSLEQAPPTKNIQMVFQTSAVS